MDVKIRPKALNVLPLYRLVLNLDKLKKFRHFQAKIERMLET